MHGFRCYDNTHVCKLIALYTSMPVQQSRAGRQWLIKHTPSEASEYVSENRYTWLPLLCLSPPAEGFPWVDLRKIFSGCQWMAKVSNAVEILPKI